MPMIGPFSMPGHTLLASMPAAGDVIGVDFGIPLGSEAGNPRPAVVVTSSTIMSHHPRTFQVVPVTSTRREWPTDIDVEAEGLADSVAQCHLLTTIPVERAIMTDSYGTIGPVALAQIRSILADILDL